MQRRTSRYGAALAFGLLAALFTSCSTAPKVARTDVGETIDLSGNWNDSDSRMTAETMIADCFSRAWLADFAAANKEKPRLIVGTVSNKSTEHINTETFVKDLEREATNSGRIRFVASKEQRDEVREERMDQAQNASMKTAKSMGQEYGADFMLKGQINTIMDAAANKEVKFYQVELELINLTSNEKVWIGQHKIKKTVKYRKNKF